MVFELNGLQFQKPYLEKDNQSLFNFDHNFVNSQNISKGFLSFFLKIFKMFN